MYPNVCWRLDDVVVGLGDVDDLGQVVEVHEVLRQPLAVRVLGGQRRLELVVLDDPALRRCRSRNMRPGWRRPFWTTVAGSMSSMPTSDAITTRPSSVTQ